MINLDYLENDESCSICESSSCVCCEFCEGSGNQYDGDILTNRDCKNCNGTGKNE